MKGYFDFLGTLPGVRELLQTLKPYFRLLRYAFFYSVHDEARPQRQNVAQ